MNVDIKSINEILPNPTKGKRVYAQSDNQESGVIINVHETIIPGLYIKILYDNNSYGDSSLTQMVFVQKNTKTIETYE